MTRDFLDVDDLTANELTTVLDRAAAIKADEGPGSQPAPLAGQTLAMIFEKPSTRTRVSFETGMTQLGGHAIFLGPQDIHLGHGEPVRDTARAVGRYADKIMARVFDHDDVETIGKYTDVPVINGLSDDAHPCQTLADLLTIREQFGFEDTHVAWIGDGNNVAQSFVIGAALVGLDLTVATPPEHDIDEDVLARAAALGDVPDVTHDPEEAVEGADLVYTDVWISMGEEDEREAKLQAFDGFQITTDLLGDRPLMHCLPAHRGEEVTDEVIESENAIVWDQAENRLHAQNGLLVWLDEQ